MSDLAGANLYYRHSGTAPAAGVVAGLAIGVLVGVVAAVAYAYSILYIPIAGYVTFIIVAAFGGLVGWATGKALHRGKVRHSGVYYGVVFAVALVAFSVSWVVWVYALLNKAGMGIGIASVFAPDTLWRAVKVINSHGAWSIKTWTPTGGVLLIFWALEAAIFFALAFALAMSHVGPFCEKCDSWGEDNDGVAVFDAGVADLSSEQREQIKNKMEGKDFRYLESLGPARAGQAVLRVNLCVCGCAELNTMTLHDITVTERKGETKTDETLILEHLLITPEERDALIAMGKNVAESQVDVVPVEPPSTAG